MPNQPAQTPDIEFCADFLHNIAWLRKHYRIPRRHLAKLLQVSGGSLAQMERGILPPEVDVYILYLIHREFGILPHEMLDGRLEEREKKEKIEKWC